MKIATSRKRVIESALSFLLVSLSPYLLVLTPRALGQDKPPPLRAAGLMPASVRVSLTERWGMLSLDVTNMTDQDRQARVLVSYAASPDVQYGRDVWVPAHSEVSTWLLLGPAPPENREFSREVRVVLQDRTDGTERIILPRESERVRSRLILWRQSEPSTSILLDEGDIDNPAFGEMPRPEPAGSEALTLARTFRAARNLSEFVSICQPGPLPPMPEGLDGVDHFVLASKRIASDPTGMRSLRQWVQRGGALWVMLDLVPPDIIAPLLGEALDFQVVDQTSLTNFAIETYLPGWSGGQRGVRPQQPGGVDIALLEPPLQQQHERPVNFVRVLLPPGEQVKHTIDGWPVWFTRKVGQGRILFTMMGPRGWHRPRRGNERSPYDFYPRLPVQLRVLDVISDVLQPIRQEGFHIASLRPGLADEVGYSTVRWGTAAGVFTLFLVATLGLGIVLRRVGRPELLGWVGPAAALAAAGVFVVLGEASRRSATATIAVGQIIEADSVTQDVSVRGEMAVYRPDSGPFPLSAEGGGLVEVNRSGVVAQTTRWVTTDIDRWHLENLSLPAGLRFSPFRYSFPTDRPIAAVARFGPEGLEGKLAAGPLRGLSDALLDAPGDRYLGVQLLEDGSFRAGSKDLLPQGLFLSGTMLSDRQQRRQEVYREYLKRPPAGRFEERSLLLAWADPLDMHVSIGENVRTAGNALAIIPLRWERSVPGSQVSIPGPLIPYRRIWGRGWSGPTKQSELSADQHLRFQLPGVVLPFKVERARLALRIDAPSRRVTIGGWEAPGRLIELHHVDSPLDPIRVDITKESLLQLDSDGGLHLNLHVGDMLKGKSGAAGGENEKWAIHYLELEVSGRAE
jgi:hypothetical protein